MKRSFVIFAIIAALVLSGCHSKANDEADSPSNTNESVTNSVLEDSQATAPNVTADTEPTETENTETEPSVETSESSQTEVTEVVTKPSEVTTVTTLLEYTVESYDEPVIMYSTISLNVRKGPSTDFESISALAEGGEATVIGIASTGWYLIEYRGEVGYVSGKYMTLEAPVPEATIVEEKPIEYPPLEPLSEEAERKLIEDYDETFPLSVREDEMFESFVYGYYGTHNGYEVVMMVNSIEMHQPMEDTYTIAGYEFWLSTHTIDYLVHIDSEFISLRDAYENGYLSDDDIAAIHYYVPKEPQY